MMREVLGRRFARMLKEESARGSAGGRDEHGGRDAGTPSEDSTLVLARPAPDRRRRGSGFRRLARAGGDGPWRAQIPMVGVAKRPGSQRRKGAFLHARTESLSASPRAIPCSTSSNACATKPIASPSAPIGRGARRPWR